MILVTGGTGLVGAHLLYFLLEKGEKIRAIHRKNSDLEAVKNVFSYYTDNAQNLYNQIEWVEANLIDIPALTDAFQGVEKVYHAAAYVSFDPDNFHKLKKSNIEGTANIVNLCLHFNVKKLCHFSSIATLGKSSTSIIHEDINWDPNDLNNVYAITKYGAEMEVWRGTQEGLDAVIVNPAVILGSGFWNSGTGRFFSKVNKGLSYFTNGSMGFVDVVDVVKISIDLMESNIKNERFILVSENITYKDLFTKIAIALHKDPPNKELQPWMLHTALYLDQIWSFISRRKQKLFSSNVTSAFRKSSYSNSKIKEALQYQFIPLNETIKTVAKHFIKDSEKNQTY